MQKPRTFAASPSPEPPIIVDTWAEQVEYMLSISFGTPSDKQSIGTQASTIHSNGEIRDEETEAPPVSTLHAEPQSSTKEIGMSTILCLEPTAGNLTILDIPPTLYEDAFRAAAQTLKLQDVLLGVQPNPTLTPWHTRSGENDSQVRAFNLFMPFEVNVLDGISPDPEPRMVVTFQGDYNAQNSALDEENRLDNGNQTGNSSNHNRHTKASDLPTKSHEKPRMETPKGTEPSPPPKKPTGKSRSKSGRGSTAPSLLDTYVLRSHPSHSQRTSDQVKSSSGHSNVHGKADGREPVVTTQPVPRMNISRAALDFASAESSPSPSQDMEISLTTGDGRNRIIGLQLFDDHAKVEADA